jgi:2-dehydrotetronate isomerase
MTAGLRFSANLGFLWTDLPLPAAIAAAAAAGFAAVECHWPYDVPPAQTAQALRAAGLPMLGINTSAGDRALGQFGLSALPDHVPQARAAIAQAISYAAAIDCKAVHVMAGVAQGAQAGAVFADNLRYACAMAGSLGIDILIEPLNPHDVAGYFLADTAQASALIHALALPNLKLMFDCYHVGRSEGDVLGRLRALLPMIGHIQIAAVPDRGPPDHGALDYAPIYAFLRAQGYVRPVGAEYHPQGPTQASLGWMRAT